MKARQTGSTIGKRMPVSPMTEVDAEKGLSQQVPKGHRMEKKQKGKNPVWLTTQEKTRRRRKRAERRR